MAFDLLAALDRQALHLLLISEVAHINLRSSHADTGFEERIVGGPESCGIGCGSSCRE